MSPESSRTSHVQLAYDDAPEFEHGRLVRDAYHSLEFTITMHWLNLHLPPTCRLLDAGSGSGRYAVALARLGHRPALLDLSNGLLSIAREAIANEPEDVRARISEPVHGDIRDLSRYPDRCFDATICLGGPLTHLPDAADRRQAVAEMARVTRIGGVMAVSVMGYWAMLRTMLACASLSLTEALSERCVSHGDTTVRGMHWHFFRANELCALMQEHGIEPLTIASCEGLSTGMADATNALATMPAQWQRWVDLLVSTSAEPAIVEIGEHILFVGRVMPPARPAA